MSLVAILAQSLAPLLLRHPPPERKWPLDQLNLPLHASGRGRDINLRLHHPTSTLPPRFGTRAVGWGGPAMTAHVIGPKRQVQHTGRHRTTQVTTGNTTTHTSPLFVPPQHHSHAATSGHHLRPPSPPLGPQATNIRTISPPQPHLLHPPSNSGCPLLSGFPFRWRQVSSSSAMGC